MNTTKRLNRLGFTRARRHFTKGYVTNVEWIALYVFYEANIVAFGVPRQEVLKALNKWRGYPRHHTQVGNLAYSSYFRGESYSGEPVPIPSKWLGRYWDLLPDSHPIRVVLTPEGAELARQAIKRLGWK